MDLALAYGRIDVTFSHQLYGHFFAPLDVQAELDLAKLAFAKGLQEKVRAKPGDLTTGMGCSVSDCCGMGVDVLVRRLRLGHESLLFRR